MTHYLHQNTAVVPLSDSLVGFLFTGHIAQHLKNTYTTLMMSSALSWPRPTVKAKPNRALESDVQRLKIQVVFFVFFGFFCFF